MMKPAEIALNSPAAAARAPPPIAASVSGCVRVSEIVSSAAGDRDAGVDRQRGEPVGCEHVVDGLRKMLNELCNLRHHGRQDEDQEGRGDKRITAEDDADSGTPLQTASLERSHDRVEPQGDEQRQRDLQEERRDRTERHGDDQGAQHADRRDERDGERTLHERKDAASSSAPAVDCGSGIDRRRCYFAAAADPAPARVTLSTTDRRFAHARHIGRGRAQPRHPFCAKSPRPTVGRRARVRDGSRDIHDAITVCHQSNWSVDPRISGIQRNGAGRGCDREHREGSCGRGRAGGP